MDYSTDLLNKITDLAKNLTPPTEIAFLIDVDERELVLDIGTKGHPARFAFFHGFALTANELRRNNLDVALAGSPAALSACLADMQRLLNDISL